jgi:hypothetical protein
VAETGDQAGELKAADETPGEAGEIAAGMLGPEFIGMDASR